MSKFTVRVELRNAQDIDYAEFHDKMAANGFSRTVAMTSCNDVLVLPHAEFDYENNVKDKAKVGKLAESIAEQFDHKPRIMVTKSAGRWYSNLDSV